MIFINKIKKHNLSANKIFRGGSLLIAVCSLFLSTNLFADTENTKEFIDKNIAVVRIMNKAAGKTNTLNLPVGKTSEIDKMFVTVRACKQTAPYTAENFYMFAEIKKNGNLIFSGWMDRNEPGDNPLQDADYDLWLINCE